MNDETTATAHVNPPQQARSRRTLERIVRAALTILDEEGPDGLTVQAVVARARSSVGSFYARFKGKEELLEYLEERVWHEARERWEAQLAERDWSSLSLEEIIRGAARLLADAHRSRAIFLQSLDRMGAGGGEGYASFRRFLLQALAELLLGRRADIRHADPELAVRLSLAALSGIVETGDPATGERFADDVTVREGSSLMLAYLMGEPSAARTQAERPHAGEVADAVSGERSRKTEREVTEGPEPDGEPAFGAGETPELPESATETAHDVRGGGDDQVAARTPTVPAVRDEGEGPDDGESREDAAAEEDEEDVDFFDVWG